MLGLLSIEITKMNETSAGNLFHISASVSRAPLRVYCLLVMIVCMAQLLGSDATVWCRACPV